MKMAKVNKEYTNEFFGLEPKRVTAEVRENEPFRLLAVPDTHFPFVKDSRLNAIYDFAKDIKPTHIVQLGDLYDQYSFSSFTKSVDFLTPEAEIKQAKCMAQDMWEKLTRIAPKASKFQVWGNHDQRIVSRIYEKLQEFASLAKDPINAWYHFNGVTDVGPYRSEVRIRVRTPKQDQEYHDVYLLHGIFSGPTSHVRKYPGDIVIRAHSHKQSLVPVESANGKNSFELDCGCILDKAKLAFKYARTFDPGWMPGFGYVEKDKNGILQARYIRLP